MNLRKFAINYLSPITLIMRFWVYIAAVALAFFAFALYSNGGFFSIPGIIVGFFAIKTLIKAIKPWYEDGYSLHDANNSIDHVQKKMEKRSKRNAEAFRRR